MGVVAISTPNAGTSVTTKLQVMRICWTLFDVNAKFPPETIMELICSCLQVCTMAACGDCRGENSEEIT
jgi:hypothetical protein